MTVGDYLRRWLRLPPSQRRIKEIAAQMRVVYPLPEHQYTHDWDSRRPDVYAPPFELEDL